jgi:ABC-type molybdate transport system substrate-binding protein
VAARAKETEAARALLQFLSSPVAAQAIAKSGLEPVTLR